MLTLSSLFLDPVSSEPANETVFVRCGHWKVSDSMESFLIKMELTHLAHIEYLRFSFSAPNVIWWNNWWKVSPRSLSWWILSWHYGQRQEWTCWTNLSIRPSVLTKPVEEPVSIKTKKVPVMLLLISVFITMKTCTLGDDTPDSPPTLMLTYRQV